MIKTLLSQRWDDLLFAHWPVEPDALRRHLPTGVEPDEREGLAWVGVVAFRMTDTRAGRVLPPRGLGSIPELNVRTYVRVAGRPGVWFLTLDTSSPLFVGVGRSLYGLGYRRADMIVAREGSRIYYVSTHGPNSFVASYEPVGRASPTEPGSLEHWLVERYRLFARRAGALVTAEVAHPPWLLQTADAHIELNTLAPAGIELAGPPLLHFSRGVDALISPPLRLELAVRAGPDAADHLAPRLLRPRRRYAPDVDAGEQRDGDDAHERRPGPRRRIVPARTLVAAEREPV
jgi:uncharacterized protein YqjF (DUF2071 family)